RRPGPGPATASAVPGARLTTWLRFRRRVAGRPPPGATAGRLAERRRVAPTSWQLRWRERTGALPNLQAGSLARRPRQVRMSATGGGEAAAGRDGAQAGGVTAGGADVVAAALAVADGRVAKPAGGVSCPKSAAGADVGDGGGIAGRDCGIAAAVSSAASVSAR